MTLAKDRYLRPATVGGLVFAILCLMAIYPARAQAVTPTDTHSTLTPAEAQRALDVLQDAGKRDDLIETLRSIVKVSPVAPALANPQADPSAAEDGFGADLLSEASSNIGVLSAEFEHSVRATTKFPLLWRWLTNTASDPEARQLLVSLLWRAVAIALLALLAERLAQFALRRPRAALDMRATHDVSPAGPVTQIDADTRGLHLSRLTWGGSASDDNHLGPSDPPPLPAPTRGGGCANANDSI
jgi:hypothetical protein